MLIIISRKENKVKGREEKRQKSSRNEKKKYLEKKEKQKRIRNSKNGLTRGDKCGIITNANERSGAP